MVKSVAIWALAAAAVQAAVARADGAGELPFEEEYVCRNERSEARRAERVPPELDEAAVLARVDRDCRSIAKAKTGRETCKRWRDEAAVRIEASRAARRTTIARRDASTKRLSECVVRERNVYLSRVAARRADEQRKADEEAEKRQRIRNLMNSQSTVRLALSALVCSTNNDRRDALLAIASEKKYARIGGVQNNTKIYELQQEVRESDQRKARFSRELKIRKLSAVKCSVRLVTQISTCISRVLEDGACLVDEVAGPLQVVRVIELDDRSWEETGSAAPAR